MDAALDGFHRLVQSTDRCAEPRGAVRCRLGE